MIIKQYEYLYKVLVIAEEAAPDHDNKTRRYCCCTGPLNNMNTYTKFLL